MLIDKFREFIIKEIITKSDIKSYIRKDDFEEWKEEIKSKTVEELVEIADNDIVLQKSNFPERLYNYSKFLINDKKGYYD